MNGQPVSSLLPPVPGFPGGTAVTGLRVYDWESGDGLCGGSPHLHTVSSEAYVVTAGTGEVHTISMAGVQVHSLAAGSLVWFSPGTVHRLVNTGGLSLNVIMSNAGLPEAGDAVLTCPHRILQEPELYAELAGLPRAAARLVRPRVGQWKELWAANVQKQVTATEQALRELAQGSAASLAGAAVASAEQRAGEGFGMCGRLTTWEDSRL